MKKLILFTILILSVILSFSNTVHLKVAEFDPLMNVPDFTKEGLEKDAVKGDYEYFLVQFNSKINSFHRNQLKSIGAEVFDYIPDNGFIVKLTPVQFNELKGKEFVRFMQIWQPAYRISPNLIYNKQEPMKNEEAGVIKLTVNPFRGEDPLELRSSLESIEGVKILKGKRMFRIAVPAEKTEDIAKAIANMPMVYWVERSYPQELHNAWSRWIMDTFDTLNMSNGSGAWYGQFSLSSAVDSARMQLYANALHGQGQIIGVDDTGLDWDNLYFYDPTESVVYDKDGNDVCEATNTNHRKVVAYNAYADTFDNNDSGHGSHTSGSAAADSLGSDLLNSGILPSGNGMAGLAKLAFTDLEPSGGGLDLPADIGDLYRWAYSAGAKITTSSWGYSAGGPGNYTQDAQNVDWVGWNNKDLCMFRSAGNSNTGGMFSSADSVNSPATAKNIVTVGATESGFGDGTSWNTVGVTSRNELLDVAEFSSHGPTAEEQMKPELCGVGGWYIWSVDSDGDLTSNNAGLTYMGGTSMSTPTTAGFGAIVRQYYEEGWYPSGTKISGDAFAPSGALVKATLINSTRNSPGAYSIDDINNSGTQNAPSMGQGWGRVTMADVIYFDGETRDLWLTDETTGFSSAGESHTYTINTGPSTAEYIKVVLVWTDYPAGVSPSTVVVNDLDLEVDANSSTYLGNVFGTSARSVTGGSADTKNVQEVVWLDAVPNSSITIRVNASNIPNGPQPYALVATGDFQTASTIKYESSTVLDSPTPVLTDGALNNGEITDIDVTVKNYTGAQQNTVTGELQTSSSYVTITDNAASFGNMADAATATGTFTVDVADNTPDGQVIDFDLLVTYNGITDTSNFSLTVSGVSYVSASADSVVFDYPKKSIKMLSPDAKDIISYDTLQYDNYPTEDVQSQSSDYWGVYFNPAASCSLKTVEWGRNNGSNGAMTDTIFIAQDNAGAPGTIIDTFTYGVPSGNNGLVSLNMDGPQIDGPFWILLYAQTGRIQGPSRQAYMIEDNAGTGNSYTSTSATGTWDDYAGGDLVIRAGVGYLTAPTDSAMLYISNNDPASVKDINITDIQIKNNASWLNVSPTSGSIAQNDSIGINIYIDTVGLLNQRYEDTLLVYTDADFEKAVTLEIPVIISGDYMTDIQSVNLSVKQDGSDALITWKAGKTGSYVVSRSNTEGSRNIIANINAGEGLNKYRDKSPSEMNYYSVGRIEGNSIVWSNASLLYMKPMIDRLSVKNTIGSVLPDVYFQTSDSKEVRLTLLDITGRQVMTLFNGFAEGNNRLNIRENIPSGIYYIRMTTPEKNFSKRITIVR
ncbi:MAG: S8 family serine peptidase [bacterium]